MGGGGSPSCIFLAGPFHSSCFIPELLWPVQADYPVVSARRFAVDPINVTTGDLLGVFEEEWVFAGFSHILESVPDFFPDRKQLPAGLEKHLLIEDSSGNKHTGHFPIVDDISKVGVGFSRGGLPLKFIQIGSLKLGLKPMSRLAHFLFSTQIIEP